MFKHILSKTLASVLFAILILSTAAFAQTTVNGIVKDAITKEVLSGATIQEKGTTNGTFSDTEGKFSLNLSTNNAKLIISFIGYKNHEIEEVSTTKEMEIFIFPETYVGSEVFVEATRVDEAAPVTFSNLSKTELAKRNLGQDVPYALDGTPSVITTSDAGAGIGYTGIRIRGVDPSRVNVTINGVPVNDAESHGVFWVNMPDILSSTENIQIQRGVGTSTNGAGAFGASINLQTGNMSVNPYASVNTGVGSFNTQKANIELGSGMLQNGWQFNGRLSQITSDGFIDRASSDLNSFYLSASKQGKRSLLKADVFSGNEVTYQAWYGVEESVLANDRTFNEAGTEKSGDPYQNQVDNYGQDYLQLHYSYQLSDNWLGNASLHYTKGQGYYEEYKAAQDLSNYGIAKVNLTDPDDSDLIRRRWLDNDFYGIIFSTQYQKSEDFELTFGGGFNQYQGAHFGEVIWSRYAGDSEFEDRYYDNDAVKNDFNVYSKAQISITEKLVAFTDLQIRTLNYSFDGLAFLLGDGVGPIEDSESLLFFNPKIGAAYQFSENHRLYTYAGIASKEPTRDEYVNSTIASRPSPETLYNLETGYKGEFNNFFVGLNTYAMIYKDQLILTGQVNDVGEYIRQNVPNSYRLGLEVESGLRLSPSLELAANATLSRNKIDEFTEYIDDYDNGGQIERNFENTDIAFSPNFMGNATLNFNKRGFSAEWISKYVSKQYLDNTQNENRSLDAYFINNLRLGYTFANLQFAESIKANLLINNVLNQTYETNGYTFGFIAGGEQRFNYYYPQAGANFLFQLSWNF